MKIGFVLPEFPHKDLKGVRYGGIGTFYKNFTDLLREQGHEVFIFIKTNKKIPVPVIQEERLKIFPFCFEKFPVFGWWVNNKKWQREINSLILENRIDIIEAPEWGGITAFLHLKATIVLRLNGSDTYFCHLEGRKQKWKNRFMEREALRSAESIVGASQFVAQKTQELFNLRKEIKVIYNGIDTEKFKPLKSVPEEKNTVLYFGTLIRKKGVLELAKIFNLVHAKKPEVTLLLIGGDTIDYKTNHSTWTLFKKLLTSKAQEKVQYLGIKPYDDLKQYIARASVIVLPSFAEAFPMTWLEAMAMEKALVTSDIGWAKEAMVDGETGYTVNPKNHAEYALRILELLEDEEKRKIMGLNARQRVVKNFDIRKIVDDSVSFYKSILNRQ